MGVLQRPGGKLTIETPVISRVSRRRISCCPVGRPCVRVVLLLAFLFVLSIIGCAAPLSTVPERYYRLMESGLPTVEKELEGAPNATREELERTHRLENFPDSILAAAILYTSNHPSNHSRGNQRWLFLAQKLGDLLVSDSEQGPPRERIDHRELYLWLETYRLLADQLGNLRRARWRKEIGRNVDALAFAVAGREHFPRYQSPFIRTSTNNYALWASTVY